MSKFMNVVRFQVKPEFKDVIVSKFAAFERPSGYQMGRLIQTGEIHCCEEPERSESDNMCRQHD